MTFPDHGDAYLGSLKRFLVFVSSLWGILGSISAFFPLSNSLIKRAIPLQMWAKEGGFAFLHPEICTAITTLVAVFVIFWTYGQRDRYREKVVQARRIAVLSFSFGLISLLLYIVSYTLMQNDFHYDVMGWTGDDPRRLFFDVILLILYIAFFGLMTRSFMLLASIEYFKRGEKA